MSAGNASAHFLIAGCLHHAFCILTLTLALTPLIRDKSRMREFCTYGSVRGALGNWRPYRDRSRGWLRFGIRLTYILKRAQRARPAPTARVPRAPCAWGMLLRTRVWIAGVRGEGAEAEQGVEWMRDRSFSTCVTGAGVNGARTSTIPLKVGDDSQG